jgi:hypothetical protein
MNKLLLLFAATIALAGCDHMLLLGPTMKGSGHQQTVTRPAKAIRWIEASAAMDVTIKIGPTPSIKVTADDNIIRHVTTTLGSDKLTIGFDQPVSTSDKTFVAITLPSLEGVTASGACHFEIDGLKQNDFTISLSGACKCLAKGSVSKETLIASGASRIDVSAIHAQSALVKISGASHAAVNATGVVTGTAEGASKVTLSGPGKSSVQTSGASSVNRT